MLNCEEILKLIRATKTFGVTKLEVEGVVIERGDVAPPKKTGVQLAAAQPSQEVLAEQHVLQEELQEIEDENLLISDPEEYEKRVGNV